MLVLILLFGCVYLYVTFFALDAASLQVGRARASDLLAALEQYRHDTESYPSALDQLVPDYLPSIPRPAWRYEYSYQACSQGTGYILYFRGRGDNDKWCGYSSGTGVWKCTDSIPPYYYDLPCGD